MYICMYAYGLTRRFLFQDPREYISLCPTSAHTGEGVADILANLVGMTQKMFVDRIMWTPMVQCTVLGMLLVPITTSLHFYHYL